MPNIQYSQILILLFQCLLVASLLLFLFRLRIIFGLGLLFTALGVFQYMQVFLASSLYIEVAPGILVSPGSAVLFSGSLFAMLLVYIREDANEARKVIYAILAANLVLTLLQIVFSWALEGEGIKNIYNLPKELFTQNARVLLVGTLALFLDSFIVIILYEAISRYVAFLFLRILFSMVIVLSIDSVLFSLGAFAGTDQFLSILVSGLISKNSAAFVYSTLFTIYLVFLDKGLGKNELGAGSFKDIFYSLTYRQKYEHVFKEKKNQELELHKSEERYRQLHETMTDCFVQTTMTGEIVDVNRSYLEMLGYDEKEIKKLKYHDITPTRWHKFEQKIVETQILPRGYSDIYEKEYIKKDGVIFPVELRTYLLRDDSGNPIGMWAIVRDITERKHAEEKIKNQLNELKKWQKTMVGREMRYIELKQEVNELLKKLGSPEKYKVNP